MSRRAAPRTRRDRRLGFTLIEALVALVTLSLVMLAAQRGIVAARTGLDRAQSSVAAEAVARSIIETELALLAAAPGMREGVTDGVAWTVASEPLPLALEPAPPQPVRGPQAGPARGPQGAQGEAGGQQESPQQQQKWRPLRVRVTVSNGRGKPLTFETIHLAVAP